MSMSVYLDSCPYDHMPNGCQNEWKDFFNSNTYELEANAFFPLFWNLLFSQHDIKRAKYIDDYDIADERAEVDRQECFDSFGETTFPYFITSQQQALENLTKRKAGFLKIFGQHLAESYEYYQSIIQEHYPQYILVRTNGLDLRENEEEYFRKDIIHYENLEHEITFEDLKYWELIQQDMRRYKDLNYFLLGTNYSDQQTKPEYVENANYAEPKVTQKDLPDFIYWIFGIIIAIPTIYVWYKTNSNLYGFITFVILAAIFSFIAIKLSSKKPIKNNTIQ